MSKKVAIFFPGNHFNTVPCILSLVGSLKDNGIITDIFTCSDIRYENNNSEIKSSLVKYIYTKNLIDRSKTTQTFIERKIPIPFLFILHNIRYLKENKYDAIIGVDQAGIVSAGVINLLRKDKIIYLSLEIEGSSGKRSLKIRILKLLEKWFHKKCMLTISQDEDRLNLLIYRNNVKNVKSCIMPNSELGDPSICRSDYFKNKFNIKRENIIILHAGALGGYTRSYEMAKEANKWSDKWNLIFHTKRKENYNENYVKNIMDLNTYKSGKVILSLEPVPYDEISLIYSGADIGIAMYEPHSENVEYMGLSSGKISQFLKYGVPVIAPNLPTIRKIFGKYRCGILVDDICQIKYAIEEILKNYKKFQDGCIMCYKELFSLNKYIPVVIEEIKAILGNTK